ncbi:helix-turn-helix domain-containing protein [Halocatena salina]|uniref:Helix-turn-helix domain-containing protein n=1 Tax=Halocatena salina TaxID=2934340 RepID=A0A8U0A8A7_9EURY|nr:helix-turn-helix domain-containing protein [Halocatena salina]UPM44263.1 helix-turn-helix domain-containing protein [Halocatena salina]
MWEVSYVMTPDRGYFDRAETIVWETGVQLESIRSMEFVSDGSVVIVYEIDGSVDALRRCLEDAPEKVVDYVVARDADPVVIQIRFYPDETLKQLLSVQRSFGVSVRFPIRYVRQDPASVEIVEVGPREELNGRIRETRKLSSIHIEHVHPYHPSTPRWFAQLTDRQQEVLRTAVRTGYYRVPRETTHEDLAEELDCCASTVGQHLRRIEAQLVASILPASSITEAT